MSDWFAANKEGLRQIAERLVERRGFGLIGGELYQNTMDTSATECHITIKLLPGKPAAEISVIDNGPGYKDLTHAWTVYAPSEKKSDPTKAGRFNVGCKMALSFCREARIHTTSGTVEFNDEGRHEFPRRKRDSGTEFWAIIDCTRERYEQFMAYMRKLLVRSGLTVFVNGEKLPNIDPINTINLKLPTEIENENGFLAKSSRNTDVEIYETVGDEPAMLYELGIPVVETGDKWHYNVMQKVPLNVDRDNVTPAYLRQLRTAVFNEMHTQISADDTTATWVQEAADDEDCTPDATKTFMDKKFGEKRVAFDPNNMDANGAALTAGFTIIPPRGMTPGQRENAKKSGFIVSSSTAFPEAGKDAYSDDPNAPPVDVVPPERWTPAMKVAYEYTMALGWKLLDEKIQVRFVNAKHSGAFGACFGKGVGVCHLDYNIWKLGKAFFDDGVSIKLNRLILHEFAHYYCGNHADDDFHYACCKLGAQLADLNYTDPKFRRDFEKKFAKAKAGE